MYLHSIVNTYLILVMMVMLVMLGFVFPVNYGSKNPIHFVEILQPQEGVLLAQYCLKRLDFYFSELLSESVASLVRLQQQRKQQNLCVVCVV